MESNTEVMSVPDFCFRHKISRSLFYKSLREGWGPKIMKAGRRTLITGEAAREWRRTRQELATG